VKQNPQPRWMPTRY